MAIGFHSNNAPFAWAVSQNPQLREFLKHGPKKLQRANTLMVNELSWGVRKQIIRTINSNFTVRRPQFVSRSVWRQAARFNTPNPTAIVGSIRRPRFDGWRSMQFGTDSDKWRVPTLQARGGNKARAMGARTKLMSGKDLPDSESIVGRSGPKAAVGMMRALNRRKDKRPFIVHAGQHPKIPGGLYRFKGRTQKSGYRPIRMLQSFEGDASPSRFDWMGTAWKTYMSSISLRAEWGKAVSRVGLRDALKRR